MADNYHWMDQGRQYHGWFGHGTGLADDDESDLRSGRLFDPGNVGQRIDAVARAAATIMPAKPPRDAKDPEGAKAPGKPGPEDGFEDPEDGENWVPNPNGKGYGWLDSKGDVWVPTGRGALAHRGPHWDVQTPGGEYRNVLPTRPSKGDK